MIDQPAPTNHSQMFLDHIRYEKRLSHHTLTAYASDLEQFTKFLTTECNVEQPDRADFRHVR
ncbi:MAG: site-specific integrase, partial [Bacteroidetes bacterium]|nr:site-specific integrase [Fibrella sp.]